MENHKKHSLGHRAFIYFLSKRFKLVIYMFAFVAVLWYSERWIPSFSLTWQIWQDYIVKFVLLLSAAYLILVLVRTYLEYRYYTYVFTEEAFVITSGYIMRKEVAALYHQIQNVNIERGILARLSGVSHVIIFMIGSEKNSSHNKIVLPAVGKRKAKLVQKELLVRARGHIMPVSARAE
jgi:uncharacterized membrane protein YdbT with pleckstrin-like domain